MFNTFWNLNFEKSKYVNLDIRHNLRIDEIKMSSSEDENKGLERAAPTRKRYSRNNPDENRRNSETLSVTTQQSDDGVPDIIQEVTGKKFSFSKLFNRRSKKKSASESTKDRKEASISDNYDKQQKGGDTEASASNTNDEQQKDENNKEVYVIDTKEVLMQDSNVETEKP